MRSQALILFFSMAVVCSAGKTGVSRLGYPSLVFVNYPPVIIFVIYGCAVITMAPENQ